MQSLSAEASAAQSAAKMAVTQATAEFFRGPLAQAKVLGCCLFAMLHLGRCCIAAPCGALWCILVLCVA